MLADPPSQIGPFKVLDFLGRAGQSAVYRVVDPMKNRTVALKLFPAYLSEDPETVERFHRELGAFSLVSRHKNLVEILGTGQEGDRLYEVMEHVDGTSLDRLLKERRLSLAESFSVLRGICRGLAYAHQSGLVHRSLTPRNVLVSPDLSSIKVGDVVASRFETGQGLSATLSTGEIRLTALYYLAPEQVDGSGQVDHRADVYSAGVIFHEMLTGRAPGPKFGLPSQLNPELLPDIDVVVLKCLARRPEERYATFLDLLQDLDHLEETLRLRLLTQIRGLSQASSRLLHVNAETGGKRSRLPLYLGLGVLLLVILAVAGYLLLG
jgi:serine/threonine-protein kinase